MVVVVVGVVGVVLVLIVVGVVVVVMVFMVVHETQREKTKWMIIYTKSLADHLDNPQHTTTTTT